MKKVFLLVLLCLLFTSCSFLFSVSEIFDDEASLTIENWAEGRVKVKYIDHDSDPELPVIIEPGSSCRIDFSDKSGSYNVRFVYDSINYEDSLYLSDGNNTYRLYLDSKAKLAARLGEGRYHYPHRLE